ncbi:Hypothetical protein NTJ_10224 [Nesidiocoris tenuis]|uniref:Lipid-binding serum glycoprotein N-terminal domain-containing protein n=1 Tax=Nesidiocoris tenuis TaxID=355587 RepID=A0ABN7B2J7_9HEMI|nr:Hypothetical protein NTJ_10224 [Nesidiocoris tenuis]
MHPQVLVLVLSAALAAAQPADDCSSNDKLFDAQILSPLRQLFKDYGVITVPSLNVDAGRLSISAQDGQAGNFTSFVLDAGGGSSSVCVSGDRTNVTLEAAVKLTELSLTFGDFELDLPLFNVGGGQMSASVADAEADVSLTILQIDGGACESTLNYFEIRDFGSVDASFQPFTIANWLSEFVLRHFADSILRYFGFYPAVRNRVEANLRDVIPHVEKELCDLVLNFRKR